ncbi:Tubby, C-terminal [Artemisia annua]|uniref:Tubby, C-terminal n=1 Tax=Artemisia annua TaxID=35608 RepID=A0A2U1P7S0_ARTAN|nr:Tubby, C-terminal [Artemisia annua]
MLNFFVPTVCRETEDGSDEEAVKGEYYNAKNSKKKGRKKEARQATRQEGQGRQNRKLGVAYHRRYNGRSEFIIAQNTKGIICGEDDSYVGSVTANLMGSKYHIWDQVHFQKFHTITIFRNNMSWISEIGEKRNLKSRARPRISS